MTGAGKALAIIGIILLSFVTLLGCGLLLLFVACDGMTILGGQRGNSSDREALAWILGFGLVFLLGGLGGIIAIARKLRRSGAQAPGVPPPGGPYITAAPLDVQPLRIALIAHFVMLAFSLAFSVVRNVGGASPYSGQPHAVRWVFYSVVSIFAYSAPYIAVFVFLFQRAIYRRALIVAIVYALASFFFSLRWLPFMFRASSMAVPYYPFLAFAGLAIDIWIAVAGIMIFQRFPDRRNAAVEFILFSVAAIFYLIFVSLASTSLAKLVYSG